MSVVESPRNLTDLSKPVLSTEVRHSEVPFLSLSLSKRGSLLLYPEPSSRLVLGDEEQAPGAKKRYMGWGWGNPRVSSLRLLTLLQRAHLLQNRTRHFKLLLTCHVSFPGFPEQGATLSCLRKWTLTLVVSKV